MQGWEMIYASVHPHKVEIVMDVLKEQDIKTVKLDKRDSSYTMIGEIEVYCMEEDAILAKIIIDQNQL
jgi:hypothetical protein